MQLSKSAALHARAEEAADVLRALSQGEVDAIVRSDPSGHSIFTIEGAEHSYSLMVEMMSEGAATLTMDGTIIYCNPSFAKLVKGDREHIIGARMHRFLLAKGIERFDALMRHAVREPAQDVIDLLLPDGSVAITHVALAIVGVGGNQNFIQVVTNLSELTRAESARGNLARIVEASQVGIIVQDLNGIVTSCNRGAEAIYGYTQDEIVGRPISILRPADRKEDLVALVARGARGDDVLHYEAVHMRKGGRRIDADLTVVPLRDENGAIVGASTIIYDISERKRAEEQVWQMANYDFLTKLANRGVFVETLGQAIARARRSNRSFGVLYLDIDHFKDVNDTLGHPIGDLLLQGFAERLRASIRATDTAARFGGDEFAVTQADIREPADAAVLANKLLKVLSEPFVIQGNEIRTGTSIGIAVYGSDSPDAEALLSHADVALFRAKSEGRATYRFFTDAMDSEVRKRVTMVAELRQAIASGELFLVYQPQVDIRNGAIVGLEALVRWRHPTRGVVFPDEFVPIAEMSGLIVKLGSWVLHEACRQMKVWLDAGTSPPLIAVNVSGMQFKSSAQLEDEIATVLAETGLPPSRLELELTESVLMETSIQHNDVLIRLRKAGIRIAIDDFGNGYSSLDYLRRFPVDRIKIAQNFILELTSNPSNAMIVKAAIGLAHELGLFVVVEGVETAEQVALIESWGCHQVQGYRFSKPLLLPEITALLRIGKIVPLSA